jgi:triacylglycerol lipase
MVFSHFHPSMHTFIKKCLRVITMLNVNLAIFLAQCCKLTYDEFQNKGNFNVPLGYNLITTFKGDSSSNKELFGYIMESDDSIVVAFRGTVTDPDWIMDAEAYQTPFPYVLNGGAVHRGFLHIYSSCRNKILNTLKKCSNHKTLYITGHSLGGGIAVLHALDAACNLHFNNLVMVNFGGPRVGNPQFCAMYNRRLYASFRIVNTFDLIPKLPPGTLYWPIDKVFHYKHVKAGINLAEQKGTVHLNHSLDTYIEGLKKLYPPYKLK